MGSIVYENSHIGAGSVLGTCVVAENCEIGGRVRIEPNTIVGSWTEIGDNARLANGSKVGPWTIVGSGAAIQGNVADLEKHLERISGILEMMKTDSVLTGDEARICAVLCEMDHADAETIGRLARTRHTDVRSAIAILRDRGIVTSSKKEPSQFALAR